MIKVTQLLVVAADDVDLDVAARELRVLRAGYRQNVEFVMLAGPVRVKLHQLMRSIGFRVDDHINADHKTPHDGLMYLARVDRLPQITVVLGTWPDADLVAVADLAYAIERGTWPDEGAVGVTDSMLEIPCVVRVPAPEAVPLPDGVTIGGFTAGQRILFADPFADTPRAGTVVGRGGGWDDMVRITLDDGPPRQVFPYYLTPA